MVRRDSAVGTRWQRNLSGATPRVLDTDTDKPTARFPRKTGLILGCLFALFSGCQESGLPRHAVQGQVRVDGQAAERVVIQFHHENPELTNDDRFPVAISDAEGQFVMGALATKPGVVAGTYKVTFNWLSSDGLDAVDRLSGKYADPQTSTFEVNVPLESDLDFEITLSK